MGKQGIEANTTITQINYNSSIRPHFSIMLGTLINCIDTRK